MFLTDGLFFIVSPSLVASRFGDYVIWVTEDCLGRKKEFGEDRLLTSYVTTSPSDKEQLSPHLKQIDINFNCKPQNILADSGYASYYNYELLDKKEIAAYMPDQHAIAYPHLKEKHCMKSDYAP